MTQIWDCADARASLGVYVLGAIDPAERSLVDAHLLTCEDCRDELAGLAQERPLEEDLFSTGGPGRPHGPPLTPGPPPPAAPALAPAGGATADDQRASELLGAGHEAPDTRIDEKRDNPLTLGGLAYLRARRIRTTGRAARPAGRGGHRRRRTARERRGLPVPA